jgi:hypothetical protein
MTYPQLQLFYFNTTHLSIEEVATQAAKNKAQQDKVMKIFRKLKDVATDGLTPFDVQRAYEKQYMRSIPITSVRRCISNLTKAAFLEKTLKKRKEKLGAKNYLWIIKPLPLT